MVITLLKLLGLPSFLTIVKVKGCANVITLLDTF